MNLKYRHVVIGGTFDILHAGHKSFIKKAFELGRLITIGVTTDVFNKKRKKEAFQDQNTRKKLLSDYLTHQNYENRIEIIFIDDIFGISLKPEIEAIVVTDETEKNAQVINEKRDELGLPRLKIIQVGDIKDESGKTISSTRIRSGEIDQQGRVYKKLLLKIAGKKFDQKIITELKLPFGRIVSKISESVNPIISVGDITTQKCLESNIIPKLSIVDFVVQREKKFESLNQLGFQKTKPDFIVTNEPGGISEGLINSISTAIKLKSNQVILVKGEEDLAVIPAVLLSSYGTKVFYGQPNTGIVEIEVSEESKNKICKILNLS